jgi:hypothetical protein
MKDSALQLTIDGRRIHTVGSVVSQIPLKTMETQIVLDGEPRLGAEGDLILARALMPDAGKEMRVQNDQGRLVNFYPNDVLLGVLGYRESSTHLVGKVPDSPLFRGKRINLLSEGGLMGEITSIPSFMGKPVVLEMLGFLRHGGNVINMSNFAPPLIEDIALPPLILVGGTSSEIGKTTLIAKIIHILEIKHGLKVGSIMLSGTGSKADALAHRAAGSSFFHSFIETGFCNTYRCHKTVFLSNLRNLFRRIAREENPDVILGELGGDYIWGQNENILTDPQIMNNVRLIIVIVNDVPGAIGTREIFKNWNVQAPVVFASSWQRSYGGMRLRFQRILREPLLDVSDWKQIEKLTDETFLSSMHEDISCAC